MTYQWRSRRPKILETHPSADVDDDDIAANVADISTDDGSQAATLRAWQDAQLDEANIQTEVNMPRSAIRPVLVMLWTIRTATLTISAAAIPMI